MEDWNEVIIACSSLAGKWQQLTGFLGLSFQQIREIKKNNCNDSADSWNEALMMWISQDYNTRRYGLPSWQNLLRTINRVDQALCEKLAREHQVKGTIAYVHVLYVCVFIIIMLIILPYMEDFRMPFVGYIVIQNRTCVSYIL